MLSRSFHVVLCKELCQLTHAPRPHAVLPRSRRTIILERVAVPCWRIKSEHDGVLPGSKCFPVTHPPPSRPTPQPPLASTQPLQPRPLPPPTLYPPSLSPALQLCPRLSRMFLRHLDHLLELLCTFDRLVENRSFLFTSHLFSVTLLINKLYRI